ncbi:MAG: GNAT family N-acetyltransferase [Promethearchaeota archaeon]
MSIRKRFRTKISRMIDLGPAELNDASKVEFKYIIMNLPVTKILDEKIEEMEEKIASIRSFLKIRFATRDDISGLCDLYNTAFFQCPDPYRPITINDMEVILEKSTILLANLYGMVSGFIILKIEENKGENDQIERVGVICGIAVHPRHRKKGVATALGLEGWNYFRDKDLDYLQCEVYEKNEPSMSFIKWVGFRPVGELVIKTPSARELNPLERI